LEEVKPTRVERALSRALRPFSNVRPDEVVTVMAMTLSAFLLMTGYYLVKTAREPLILLQWGAEAKLYAEAGQAVLLLGVVRVYSAIARRVGRMRLLAIVYAFFTSNMLIFAALARAGLPIGLAFFLWVGVFSYTSIAQFWAFAADIYTEEQGKRLFAIVGAGSSIGSVAGALVARTLVASGAHVLMLGAAVLVLGCVGLILVVARRTQGTSAALGRVEEEAPVARETPLELLLADRYLLLIGGLTLALNCVSGLGDYILDRTLLSYVASARAAGATPATFVGSFKATFFAWYNLLGVLLQLFAVSRVLTKFGVRTALLVLPVTAALGYGSFAIAPSLAMIRMVVIADRALDYSLTNTSRHALFLVATRAEKYVGKTLVDTVGARLGDLVSAIVVWCAIRAGARPADLALVCVAMVCGWVAIVLGIGGENARRLRRAASLEAPAV
jgi:AAA family ATP:ADP antiporter